MGHGPSSRYVDGLVRRFKGIAPAASVVAAVARRLPAATGLDLALLDRADLGDVPPPPAGADVDVLVLLYERLLDDDVRSGGGVHYTPRPVAEALVELALDAGAGSHLRPASVLDPTCGSGAFLLAACRCLHRRGSHPSVALAMVAGSDIDAEALAVAEAVLLLWAASAGGDVSPSELARPQLQRCDPLLVPSDGAPLPAIVVGNPPFLDGLDGTSALGAQRRAVLRDRFGPTLRAYTDQSALFLLAAMERVEPGGVVAMIQPRSLLATRDAEGVRRRLLELGALRRVWLPMGRPFSAQVEVCATVLVRGGDPLRPVDTVLGALPSAGAVQGPSSAALDPGSWAPLAGTAGPASSVAHHVAGLEGAGVVGDLATTTAGFRDEYYGLIPHTFEEPDLSASGAQKRAPEGQSSVPRRHARLTTVGLIDPAHIAWGERSARFAKQPWTRPLVDLAALAGADARLARWVEARLVPKVLVATQTRVLEAAVDEHGEHLPVTPLISVEPHSSDDLWLLGAALLAPPICALAHSRHGGAALTATALKLSAAQVAALPLPSRRELWERGASTLAELRCGERPGDGDDVADADADAGAWAAFAATMCEAYGVDPAVGRWWLELMGGVRGGTTRSATPAAAEVMA